MEFSVVMIVTLAILLALGYIGLMIYLIFFYSKGKAGEKAVARRLKRLPEEEYKVINDLMLPTSYGTTQIDHVVVSRYGIFVIETKNYKGYVYGGENAEYWTQNIWGNKYSMPNPIRQNNTHIKALRYHLNKLNIDCPIHSIVTFAGRCSVSVNVTENCNVVYYNQVLPVIKRYQVSFITQDNIERTIRYLSEINIIDKTARKNHNYRVRMHQFERQQKIEYGICPRCGGMLVRRKGKYGHFLGCSNYPKCNFIQNKEY